MKRGLDGFDKDIAQQAEVFGEGGYRAIVRKLHGLPEEALLPLKRAWSSRPFSAWYDRPLLLMASLRFLALEDIDHPLAPELLDNEKKANLLDRMLAALQDSRLEPLLAKRTVQTNDPGRAIGWGLAARHAPNNGFALVDLGCSGGLNLVADHVAMGWIVDDGKLDARDFPAPRMRLGLDSQPVDVADGRSLRWLRACTWPGDQRRVQHLERAINAAGRVRPTVRQHRLGVDSTTNVLRAVEDAHDVPVIAFQSVVRDYMSPDEREVHAAEMREWADDGERHIWVTLEPGPDPAAAQPAEVRVTSQGEEWLIARTEYHPRTCTLGAFAADRLEEIWN